MTRPEGNKVVISTSHDVTVKELKTKIEEKTKFPAENQRLTSGKKQLDDGDCLHDYKIKEDSSLTLTLNNCGGMESEI